MSLDKARRLIRLATLMQVRYGGVSLGDIMEEFGVSRRTAERMRDEALGLAQQVDVRDDETGQRRWRILGTLLPAGVASIGADDLASLQHASRQLADQRQHDHAERLRNLADKILAQLSEQDRLRLEPDLDLLSCSEGIARRPGPRRRIDPAIQARLREAILTCSRIEISYRRRGEDEIRIYEVDPYGFLYGNRHFLVAYSHSRDGFRIFHLDAISAVRSLGTPFVRDPSFSLDAFASESFGAFRGDGVYDIEWRFSQDVADDVRQFDFHPTQQISKNDDGSITVTFRASGLLEMCWHLVQWSGHVEIVRPEELKRLYRENILETAPLF